MKQNQSTWQIFLVVLFSVLSALIIGTALGSIDYGGDPSISTYIGMFLAQFFIVVPIILLLKKSNKTEVNFIKKVFNKSKRLKNDYTEIMNLMKKYKINDDVRIFCNKYNKKSLKILKLFEGYQKDLFINLLMSSINRTY